MKPTKTDDDHLEAATKRKRGRKPDNADLAKARARLASIRAAAARDPDDADTKLKLNEFSAGEFLVWVDDEGEVQETFEVPPYVPPKSPTRRQTAPKRRP